MKKAIVVLIMGLFFAAMSAIASADYAPPAAPSKGDLETAINKQVQNPLSGIIVVPIMSNWEYGAGPKNDKSLYNLSIMPTFPIMLPDNWDMINHLVLQVNQVPTLNGSTDTGFGNLAYSVLFTKNDPDKPQQEFTFGAGGGIMMPTASYTSFSYYQTPTGMNAWAAGPAVVGVFKKGSIVAGALFNQMWSFAGNQSVNMLQMQGFANYNVGDGIAFSYCPTASVNWQASGEKVLLPLGLGVSKLFLLGGKLPLGIGVQYYYNVLHPTNAPEQEFRLQLFTAAPEAIL